MIYYFKTEHLLPVSIDEAWDFFSSAKNLARITPPEMDFKILSNLDEKEIYEGMIIDYIVKPAFGIPLKWQTEIINVNKPHSFADKQLKGPYKIWEHTHTFIQQGNGILMQDEIKYQIPFGIIGQIAHSLFVREKVKDIFRFREKALDKIFGTSKQGSVFSGLLNNFNQSYPT
ncbi:SRPBCC family protein [Daejeonella sp.]|uniref:SRPBCC family protein n=1 Tax=Daejeonella sp. TaxID=2805397 RepID=UPI0027320B1D|nr:SRPBCC family protein [Daejeonella sp.]MDP2413650.1 SRPBCC family protein [Daejeonella sp.]